MTTPIDIVTDEYIQDNDIELYYCLSDSGFDLDTCRDYDDLVDACLVSEEHIASDTCTEGGTLDSCVFLRFLSVTCLEENGNVFIRYQSAGAPDYCWNTSWSSNVATA